MKVSGEGAPKRTETEKKKSHLADYLEPNEDEEDEEDSDSGEIIDRSESSAFVLRRVAHDFRRCEDGILRSTVETSSSRDAVHSG